MQPSLPIVEAWANFFRKMEISATLTRYRLLAVLAGLVIWLAQPALGVLCPCLSVAVAADVAVAGEIGHEGASSCCEHCCPAQPEVYRPLLTRPRTGSCPLLNLRFYQTAALEAKSLARSTGVGFAQPIFGALDFSPPLASFGACAAHPTFCLPRALAALVAGRCHPCHAPPVS